jgi:uncharacterized lipoprotein
MKILFLLTTVALLSACSSWKPEPWVKAHERELLSSPIMSLERDPISTKYINHVYEAREAARGAEGSAGGGCGCN